MADRYAVLGWPIEHSVSPQMQGAGLAGLGLAATYEKIAVPPPALSDRVKCLVADGYRGWNVTVPHKRQMMALMDRVEAEARLAESVNTVVNLDGVLHGHSTDGYGLAAALKEAFGVDVPGRRFVFWGCGGAARATAVHFGLRGAARLTIVNRTVAKAAALVDVLAAAAPRCTAEALAPEQEADICDRMASCDALIQATSLGLRPDDPVPFDPTLVPARVPVMDMIYRQTPLLRAVAERGCRTADGRTMLLHQGVKSLLIWTGREPPLAPMRAALEAALTAG